MWRRTSKALAKSRGRRSGSSDRCGMNLQPLSPRPSRRSRRRLRSIPKNHPSRNQHDLHKSPSARMAPRHFAKRKDNHKMMFPMQTTFRNMDHSDAVVARLQEQVAKLEKYFDRI